MAQVWDKEKQFNSPLNFELVKHKLFCEGELIKMT